MGSIIQFAQRQRGKVKLLFFAEMTVIFWFALVGQSAQAAVQHVLGVGDLAMHMAAFLIASSTAVLVWPPAAVISLLLGAAASIELAQAYVPGRQPSVVDFLASGAGIVVAILVARLVWPHIFVSGRLAVKST